MPGDQRNRRPSAIRVSCFIDGFNLYYSLRDTGQDYLKWLDVSSLCEALLARIRLPSVHPAQMGDVYYFSAIAKHLENQSGVAGSPTGRHREYIRAIKHFGVIDRLSGFKRKTRSGHVYHEEKGTDVWLAATLIESVFSGRCDGAVIVSGDTDFAPACHCGAQEGPGMVRASATAGAESDKTASPQ